MAGASPPDIRIAAALIEDDQGRLLLVRKAGTQWFMQAGGKIEPGESAHDAMARELGEEIGLAVAPAEARHLGRFTAPAANETGLYVEAELFHLRVRHDPAPGSEIAEAVWVAPEAATALSLAPLTRDHVLPLARRLAEERRDAAQAPSPQCLSALRPA